MSTSNTHGINLRLVGGRSHALSGTRSSMPVMLDITTIEAPANVASQRAPMHLAIVLDRSGSMQGPKLEQCKIGVLKVMSGLDAGDRLSLITYDNAVNRVFTYADANTAESHTAAVRGINPGGSTFLSGGLEEAEKVLAEHTDGMAKRVFLFSDGMANAGERTTAGVSRIAQRMRDAGIVVSAFGIGDQYNEEMMQAVAESGSGEYYYIQGDVDEIIDVAFQRARKTLTNETQLYVRGLGGAMVTRVHGFEDWAAGVQLGPLRYSLARKVVIDVEVPATGASGDVVDIAECRIVYKIIDGDGHESSETRTMTLAVTITEDPEVLAQSGNAEVRVAAAIAQNASSDAQAAAHVNAGRWDDAVAVQEEALGRLREVAKDDTSGSIEQVANRVTTAIAQLKSRKNAKHTAKYLARNAYHHAKHDCSDFGLM